MSRTIPYSLNMESKIFGTYTHTKKELGYWPFNRCLNGFFFQVNNSKRKPQEDGRGWSECVNVKVESEGCLTCGCVREREKAFRWL